MWWLVALCLCVTGALANVDEAVVASVEVLNQKDPVDAAHTYAELATLDDVLGQLYELCRRDAVCSSRFFMSDSATAEPRGNDAALRLQTATDRVELTKFKRLVVLWQMDDDCPLQDNALRSRIYLSDYATQDAAWWLTMLRTARFCGDNQMWLMGSGCVVKRDRLNADGSEVNPDSASVFIGDPWAVMAIVVFGLIVIAIIVYVLMQVQQQFGTQKKYIESLQSMWDGEPPATTLGHQLIGMAITEDMGTREALDVLHSAGSH